MAQRVPAPEQRIREYVVEDVEQSQRTSMQNRPGPRPSEPTYTPHKFAPTASSYQGVVVITCDNSTNACVLGIPTPGAVSDSQSMQVKVSFPTSENVLSPHIRIDIEMEFADDDAYDGRRKTYINLQLRDSVKKCGPTYYKLGQRLPDDLSRIPKLRAFVHNHHVAIINIVLFADRTVYTNSFPGTDFGPFQPQVNVLRDCLKRGKALRLVVRHTGGLPNELSKLCREREELLKTSPISRFLKHSEETITTSSNNVKRRNTDHGLIAFAANPTSPSIHEAINLEMIGIEYEQEYIELSGDKHKDYEACFVLSDEGEMVCMLHKDSNRNIKLEVGQSVVVIIKSLEESASRLCEWDGKILKPPPELGSNYVPILICPNIDCNVSAEELDSLNLEGTIPSQMLDQCQGNARRISAMLDAAHMHAIDIHVHAGRNGFNTKAKNLALLHEDIEIEVEGPTGFSVSGDLLMGRFDRLPTVDCVSQLGLPSFDGDNDGLYRELDREQQDIIRSLSAAPAGLVIVQGPAGTGKTFIAGVLLHGLLISSKSTATEGVSRDGTRVLFITPTNTNLDKNLRDFVNRASSRGLDDAVFVRALPYRVQQITHGIAIEGATPQVRSSICKQLFEEDPKHAGLDARSSAQGIAHSHCQWIVRACIDDCPGEYLLGPALQRVRQKIPEAIRNIIKNGISTLRMTLGGPSIQAGTHTAADDLYKAIENALPYLAQCTDATLGTPHQVAQPHVRDHVDCTLIFVDEAARIAAAESLVVRTFNSVKCTILAGDIFQSRPQISGDSRWNEVALQAALPLFSRLRVAGFPVHTLSTVRRYNASLLTFINNLVYRDPCMTAHRDNVFEPVIRKTWPALETRDDKSILLVNVANTREEFGSRRSVYNPLLSVAMLKIIRDLRNAGCVDADIAVITPYDAQARLNRMILENEASSRGTHHAVECCTFNLCQGSEWDIVIHVIPNVCHIGVLDDMAFLVTALTRARQAVIIIADVDRLRSPRFKGFNGSALQTLIRAVENDGAIKRTQAVPSGHPLEALLPRWARQ